MQIGIIGASFARAAFLPALRHVQGAEIVALASARLPSARSAADAFGIKHAYDDWRLMLERHKFDLVLIATPTDTHAPMTLAALEAGAHVLCEKPTAMNAGEAAQMLERAEALGRVHMIDHELRFNPNRQRVQKMIAAGELGDIRHVNIANMATGWNDPASRPKGDWLSSADHGDGRLGALGSHQVDMLRWWLGAVKSVSGTIATTVASRVDEASGEAWTATADDLAQFTLKMESGALAQVFISAVTANGFGNLTQVFGSKGTISLSGDTEQLLFARAGQSFEDITETDPNAGLDGLGKGIWSVSVVSALRELVGAIREGRPLRAGATFRDGLANQRVLDGVILSSRKRCWIDLDAY